MECYRQLLKKICIPHSGIHNVQFLLYRVISVDTMRLEWVDFAVSYLGPRFLFLLLQIFHSAKRKKNISVEVSLYCIPRFVSLTSLLTWSLFFLLTTCWLIRLVAISNAVFPHEALQVDCIPILRKTFWYNLCGLLSWILRLLETVSFVWGFPSMHSMSTQILLCVFMRWDK